MTYNPCDSPSDPIVFTKETKHGNADIPICAQMSLSYFTIRYDVGKVEKCGKTSKPKGLKSIIIQGDYTRDCQMPLISRIFSEKGMMLIEGYDTVTFCLSDDREIFGRIDSYMNGMRGQHIPGGASLNNEGGKKITLGYSHDGPGHLIMLPDSNTVAYILHYKDPEYLVLLFPVSNRRYKDLVKRHFS